MEQNTEAGARRGDSRLYRIVNTNVSVSTLCLCDAYLCSPGLRVWDKLRTTGVPLPFARSQAYKVPDYQYHGRCFSREDTNLAPGDKELNAEGGLDERRWKGYVEFFRSPNVDR